ncbi:hypothetical protein [Saccharothrix australiensis]|uniref:hypothetical protein n=1 Tax=Saccharothrix australiensis TaxID=2072 RepID=UPI0014773A3E|nr:hypothetical protein [Saccharothrix australiensis]
MPARLVPVAMSNVVPVIRPWVPVGTFKANFTSAVVEELYSSSCRPGSRPCRTR